MKIPTFLILALVLFVSFSSRVAEPMSLVFLLTDDQTIYSLGCYGNDDVKTPHMDSLAKDGIAFDRHYDTKKNKSMAKYAEEFPHASVSYCTFGRDFIKESAGRCSVLSFNQFQGPHMPATPDPQFDHVYEGKTFKKPVNYGRENGEHFSIQSRQGRQYERFESWGCKDNYDQVMATYHQQIYGVDVAIGMICEALEEAGVADKTVIIFTSDNGFLCGSHGYGSKVIPYEESSRAPMIMYIPGHENSGKQLRSSSLTGNTNFYPTMLELASVEVPEGIDGKSLLPLYDNPEGETHTASAH